MFQVGLMNIALQCTAVPPIAAAALEKESAKPDEKDRAERGKTEPVDKLTRVLRHG